MRNSAAAPVANREHHAVPEAVVALAVVLADQHTGGDELVLALGAGPQFPLQIVPARRGKAETEFGGALQNRFRVVDRDQIGWVEILAHHVAELINELTDDYDPHPELFDLADETLAALSAGEVAGIAVAGVAMVIAGAILASRRDR